MIQHRLYYPANDPFTDLSSSLEMDCHSYWNRSLSKHNEKNLTYIASMARSVGFVVRAERRPSGCTFAVTFWRLGGGVSAAASLLPAAF